MSKFTYYTFEGPIYLTDGSKLNDEKYVQTLHMSIKEGDKYNDIPPKVEFSWDILEKTEPSTPNGPRYQLFDSCNFSITLRKENDYYFISEYSIFNGNIRDWELPKFEIFYMLGKQHIGVTDERTKKEINELDIDRSRKENRMIDEGTGSWYENSMIAELV